MNPSHDNTDDISNNNAVTTNEDDDGGDCLTELPNGSVFGEISLDNRACELAMQLFNKDSELNLDCILDSLQSIYFEICNSNIKSSGYDYYCNKFQDAIDSIHRNRVNINDFEQLKLLGQGGFGKVELVRHKATNNIYAMKTMNKSLLLRSNQSAFFLAERHIMALSNSPWIVKLHYAFIAKDDIFMVMDFMQGGDLINLMSSYDLPMGWSKFYAAEAAIAINALHEFGFIHLDVKPDNMLLDKSGHLKLCDFGTCVNVRKTGVFSCNFAVGTPDYISPEMLASHNKPTDITKATDWWSYAVFLYELLFEETPFASDSLIGTYTKIANFKSSLRFPDETKALKPACNLISRLLVEAHERPGFEEIKKDTFFVNDEWNFDNIRQCKAAFVPEIQDDQDTSNFDVSESNDVSGITPTISKSTSPNYSRVGGDHLNFVGFSFNPSLHNIIKFLDGASTRPRPMPSKKMQRNKSITEEYVGIEIDEFKEKLASYQKLLNEIEAQNKTLSQNKNEVSIQLQNVSLQLQQASEKNQLLQSQLEAQLSKDSQNHAQTQEYISQISQLTAEIDAEKEKCRQLENEKVQFELRYNDFEHNSMTLQRNYGGVEKKLLQLQLKYEKSLAEMDRLSSELQLEKQRNLCLKTLAIETENKAHDQVATTTVTNKPPLLVKQSSISNDLISPAVMNRTTIMLTAANNNEPASTEPSESEQSIDKMYLKTELQHLKEVLKQSTENECKIKNDLRLVTNENERLKQELLQTMNNIRNNAEFIELEHKCKSLDSYVNLYKKQLKDLTARVETLKNDSNEAKSSYEKQIHKTNQLESDLNTIQTKYLSEVAKNKELYQEVELNKSNHTFQINELQKQHSNTQSELETTRKNLFEQENKVMDLTKSLANLSLVNEKNAAAAAAAAANATTEATATSATTTTTVSTGADGKPTTKETSGDDNKNWKEMYSLEKMKKDQAIKKLDEMIFLFNKKGKTIKPVVNPAVNQETKTTKKLQMELRNERLRYEKLMLEKQAALFEYNETLTRLETKVSKLRVRNEQLQGFIHAATNKTSTTSLSSTFGPIPPQNDSDERDLNVKPLLNVGSHSEAPRYSASHMDNNLNDMASENDPFYSTISTADEPIAGGFGVFGRGANLTTKPNVHFESYVWLIPFNKMKRATRKLPWKKYYAVLTLTHFIVYTEKVEKENPKKIFKKIPLEHIQQAFHVTHNEFRKAEPKDIPKIFCVKYYDEDLANVTTKFDNKTLSKSDKKSTDPPPINDYKGHQLVPTDTDNQPFCGACSLNLSINFNGEHLHRCYECKLCELKFHFFHITSNDDTLIDCSKIPSNINTVHQKSCFNSNFVVDMYILSPSVDDRTKWLYSFNQLAHINISTGDMMEQSSRNNSIRNSNSPDARRPLKKRNSILLRLSPSKSKGFSTS